MSLYKKPLVPSDLPDTIPYQADISVLNTPCTIGSKQAPNRICYQPMEGCDGTADGAPDELTIRRYERFAHGGAGLIWFEATAIVPEGRANPRQLYLTEKNAPQFAALIARIKEICLKENGYEPLIVCQLTHSGRWSKPSGVSEPLIAYNKPIFEKNGPLPASCVVSDAYLDGLSEIYAHSAKLCEAVGFDGVDIKACHGYLLSELLNAYLRPGKHGGSLENRTRLFMDAVSACRAACASSFLLASRFNAYDGYPHPWGIGDSGEAGVPDLTEAKAIASGLEKRGVSLLNVTMGCPYTNHEVNRPTVSAETEPPYRSICRMIAGASAVRQAAPHTAVVASGFTFLGALAPNVAAYGIENEDYDFVGFGRQNFAYPMLAADILKNGGMKEDALCLTCGKCTQLMRGGKTPGCVIYDKDVYLPLFRSLK